MIVSILGTNGFLSTALARFCNKMGYSLQMYGLEYPNNCYCETFKKLNIINEEIDYNILCQSDIIIYSIGAGIQSNLRESINKIYTLNVTVPINICNKLKIYGYSGYFITFGSIFEIGKTLIRHPFCENDILLSQNEVTSDYAISKRLLTRFITSYEHNYTHWHFIIPTIYGEGENTMRLIPYTLDAIRNSKTLSFTGGDQIRQYVYVNDVPTIIYKSLIKQLPSGVYNIEGPETLSVKEIVTLLHTALGKIVPEKCFGTYERSDSGMKYLALNGNKLYSAINYFPSTKIIDIINLY